MVFNYNNLKQAAKEGSRLGKWKDLPVFSCDRRSLSHKGNGAYYVVYDDDNALVKKMADTWFKYGYVDQDGVVHEESSSTYTLNPKPQVPDVKPTTTTTTSSAPGKTETKKRDEVVADVRIDLDVDATLQRARKMTVEDLLEGFNYGL